MAGLCRLYLGMGPTKNEGSEAKVEEETSSRRQPTFLSQLLILGKGLANILFTYLQQLPVTLMIQSHLLQLLFRDFQSLSASLLLSSPHPTAWPFPDYLTSSLLALFPAPKTPHPTSAS